MAMDRLHINPLRPRYWTAVINGLLAPFLLVGIVLAGLDRTVMKGQPSSRSSIAVVSFAVTLLIFGRSHWDFVFLNCSMVIPALGV